MSFLLASASALVLVVGWSLVQKAAQAMGHIGDWRGEHLLAATVGTMAIGVLTLKVTGAKLVPIPFPSGADHPELTPGQTRAAAGLSRVACGDLPVCPRICAD